MIVEMCEAAVKASTRGPPPNRWEMVTSRPRPSTRLSTEPIMMIAAARAMRWTAILVRRLAPSGAIEAAPLVVAVAACLALDALDEAGGAAARHKGHDDYLAAGSPRRLGLRKRLATGRRVARAVIAALHVNIGFQGRHQAGGRRFAEQDDVVHAG